VQLSARVGSRLREARPALTMSAQAARTGGGPVAWLQQQLRLGEPPRWAVLAVALVLAVSGCGTLFFWGSLYFGRELCVECVPFGLSTYRFLYWPMADFLLGALCLGSAMMLVRKAKFAFLAATTLALDFVLMAFLAWYQDLFVREKGGPPLQPQFLNLWFIGWGCFLLWFMAHWKQYWMGETSGPALPVARKRGTL
jgi:hypothetical protein